MKHLIIILSLSFMVASCSGSSGIKDEDIDGTEISEELETAVEEAEKLSEEIEESTEELKKEARDTKDKVREILNK